MRIINIGICTNNIDPKGLGRIRYKPYGTIKSEIDKAIQFNEWDDNDPLIAIPFLPLHINVVPQVRQSIKLIRYDSDKPTQNIEYIVGPFATPHNFGDETFTTQHKNTTYGGVIVKKLPDIKDINGNYIEKQSSSSLTNLYDFGINGNYGSDVIFSENGLILRGGKLIPKQTKNVKNKQKLQEVPILSEKIAKLMLKKFTEKMYTTDEDEEQYKLVVSKIKYIIEYELDSLSSPTELRIFVYKILNSNDTKYNTDTFNNTTETDITDIKTFKLVNSDNSSTTPTTTLLVSNIDDSCSELRDVLYKLNYKGLYEINTLFSKEDIHPCYFRPTKDFRLLKSINETEASNKSKILSSYKIANIKESGSLIYSRDSVTAPYIETTTKVKKLKTDTTSEEQTFGALSSDFFYLLSTNANKGSNNLINFNELNQYEFTQEDYLTRIHPNTYSLVRGEELIKIILLIYEFMIGHVHNINKPGIYLPQVEQELKDTINKIKTNLINESIRIN